MTAVSKNVHINKLDETVDKNSNTYHKTMTMKSADVKMDTYLELDVKMDTYIYLDVRKDDKDPEFNVNDHVRISKYQKAFVKGYKPKSSEEVLAVKNVRKTVLWTHVTEDLKGEDSIRTFLRKEASKDKSN